MFSDPRNHYTDDSVSLPANRDPFYTDDSISLAANNVEHFTDDSTSLPSYNGKYEDHIENSYRHSHSRFPKDPKYLQEVYGNRDPYHGYKPQVYTGAYAQPMPPIGGYGAVSPNRGPQPQQRYQQYDTVYNGQAYPTYLDTAETPAPNAANAANAPADPNAPVGEKKKRFRKRTKIICALLCFIVLALAIILPVLFCVRREVTFNILPLAVDDQVVNIDPSGFVIPVNPTIRVENDNFFDITLSDVVVEGSHPLYGGGAIPLGTGLATAVVLDNRATTDFIFPFLVQYNRTFDESFAYFSEILSNCTNPVGATLYFGVDIKATYSMWAKSDSIHEKRSFTVPCPITPEEALQVRNIVGGQTAPAWTPPTAPPVDQTMTGVGTEGMGADEVPIRW